MSQRPRYMRASEMIARLQELIKSSGDDYLAIFGENGVYVQFTVEPVDLEIDNESAGSYIGIISDLAPPITTDDEIH